MSNLETALALAGAGLFVFPCQGTAGDSGKVPPAGFGWKGESTTDPDKIRRWFMRWPGATVALDLGKSGLFVVDCDKPDNADQLDGQEYFESVILSAGADSFPFVTSKTPSSGVHYIFRQPDGDSLGNGRGGLPKKRDVAIDVRGRGGYIIAPGATMQDGRAYVLGGSIDAVPAMPEWLLTIMRAKTEDEPLATPTVLPVVSFPPSTERIGAYSRAGFDAEIAEVRTAPKGTRNDTLNTSAFKIGTMCAAGWVSESEAYSALVGAVAGWADQKKTIDTLKRGLREGVGHPRAALAEDSTPNLVAPLMARLDGEAAETPLVAQADGTIVNDITGEVVSQSGDTGAGGFPATLHPGFSVMNGESMGLPKGMVGFPPGLVGEIAEWIVGTSRQPQPVLALGAALTIVGAAAGQRFYGPTDAGLHLFVMGLGRTGVGKDRPLKACVSALLDAGLNRLVGGSQFISMQAVINSTERNPVSLWAMDEFGSYLARINGNNASSWEKAVSGALRTLWSAQYVMTMTPEAASCPARAIFAPCLSIFGVSTPDEFLGSLSGGDVKNGLLNRMLILPQARHVAARDPKIRDLRLPKKLITGLRELRGGDPASPMVDVCAAATPDGVAPLTLGWDNSPGWEGVAEREWLRLEAHRNALGANEEINGGNESDFFVRTPEMALRIASIIAVGRGSTTVNVVDVMWGAELAARSAHAFIEAFNSHVSASDHSARVEFVEAEIKARRTITRSALTNATRKRMDAKQLDGILRQLAEAERIVVERVRKGTRGPPAEAYRWAA